MTNRLRYSLLCLVIVAQTLTGKAQVNQTAGRPDSAQRHITDTGIRHQIAIFVPLYLDSAFDASNNYRYDKNFPKFINPGLEFFEGVQLALDSLAQEKVPLDVHIYDTRSVSRTVGQVLQSGEFQQTELIIGHVVPGELQQLAAAAARMNIPFINVNFPSDGGITNNPDFVILNSTLKTHCEGIYKFIQRNYPTKPIYWFRKKGQQEDRLQHYFMEMEKTTVSVPLKIKYITLADNFNAATFVPYLDSNTHAICIAGSLDEYFGKSLCQALSSINKTYATTIIGMPTWDNIADFSRPEYNNQEIIYSTPFYINPADNLVKSILQYFRTKFYSRPSDMVFRGYEVTYRFARLLQQYGKNLSGSIGEKKYKVFTDFNIEPVFLNRQTMTLDYFENRKLYFIRKTDGNMIGFN